MKKRINLYLPELHPVQQRLSLPHIVLLCGLALLGCVIASVTGNILIMQEKKQIPLLTTEFENLTQQKKHLSDTLAQRRPASFLMIEFRERNEELEAKQLLLAHIDKLGHLDSQGFSPWMRDLALSHRSDISVQSFDIENNQIQITGDANGNDAVPAWIASFKDYPKLQDRQFSALQVERSKQGVLQFKLESRASAGTDIQNQPAVAPQNSTSPTKNAVPNTKMGAIPDSLNGQSVPLHALSGAEDGTKTVGAKS